MKNQTLTPPLPRFLSPSTTTLTSFLQPQQKAALKSLMSYEKGCSPNDSGAAAAKTWGHTQSSPCPRDLIAERGGWLPPLMSFTIPLLSPGSIPLPLQNPLSFGQLRSSKNTPRHIDKRGKGIKGHCGGQTQQDRSKRRRGGLRYEVNVKRKLRANRGKLVSPLQYHDYSRDSSLVRVLCFLLNSLSVS